MITVVVFAQKPNPAAQLIARTLSRYGTVHVHFGSSFEALGDGQPVCSVHAVSRLERLHTPEAVLVLADQSAPRRPLLREDAIVVAGADNRRMRRQLGDCLNPVVTCGTGVRDTLTVSSISPDSAILCAQRELPTAAGIWLEPAEFRVELCGCDLRSALLAAGTAAVCGCDLSAGTVRIGSKPLGKEKL